MLELDLDHELTGLAGLKLIGAKVEGRSPEISRTVQSLLLPVR